jgi:hypothetical protein
MPFDRTTDPETRCIESVSDALQPPVLDPDAKKQKVGREREENETQKERAGSSRYCLVDIKHGETSIAFCFEWDISVVYLCVSVFLLIEVQDRIWKIFAVNNKF